jgi:dTDP-4-amino-4,6-dideoxygalactose transaminase
MSKYYRGIGPLPNLARNAGRLVSLPIYPSLQHSEVRRIVNALRYGIETGLQ